MFGKTTCGETHLYREEGTEEGFYPRKDTAPALLLLAPPHPVVLCSRASEHARTPLPAQGRAQGAKEELRAVFCRQPGRSVWKFGNVLQEQHGRRLGKLHGTIFIGGCTWKVKNAGLYEWEQF